MKIFPENARVVFLGDSITAACNFATRVSEYYIKNFPELRVKFKNSGVAGGTLQTMLDFFEIDTLPFAPTHAFVMSGVNDSIRWVLAQPRTKERDEELLGALETYKINLARVLELLKKHNIEVTLITPAPYAEFVKDLSEPLVGGHELIYHYAEAMRKEARRQGIELIDFHSRLSELCMHKDIYDADRIHPNDLGHYYMANEILRAQSLEYGEYCSLSDILASDEKICSWNACNEIVRRVFATEWMIVKKPNASTEEKLDFINDFINRAAWGRNAAFESFARSYLELKPLEAENTEKISSIMENMYI